MYEDLKEKLKAVKEGNRKLKEKLRLEEKILKMLMENEELENKIKYVKENQSKVLKDMSSI